MLFPSTHTREVSTTAARQALFLGVPHLPLEHADHSCGQHVPEVTSPADIVDAEPLEGSEGKEGSEEESEGRKEGRK
jgi:hypothetical protein